MLSLPLAAGAEVKLLEPWHATELADCIDTARAHLAEWTLIAHRVVDEASARKFLQHYADQLARDGARYYGIWLDGTLAGGVLFRTFDAHNRTCEVGGWLTPRAMGRGLITSAFTRMIDWAIGDRGIRRVELRASPANTRGCAIAARLGMTREALLRDALTLNGQQHDSEVWAILAGEWLKRHTAPRTPG